MRQTVGEAGGFIRVVFPAISPPSLRLRAPGASFEGLDGGALRHRGGFELSWRGGRASLVGFELVPAEASSSRSVMFADGWLAAKVFDRECLSAGARFRGPALVFERHCATVVHPQWNGWMDGARCLVLQRVAGGRGDGVAG